MPQALAISVTFPNGVYSGSDLGAAEDLPAPSRVHDAFVAAAAGGSWASPEGRVLVASEEHRAALVWLEENEPHALLVPRTVLNERRATRYRERSAPGIKNDTGFEPSAAINGPVVYLWPPAPADVIRALSEIATEVTHVGRADSIARVAVNLDDSDSEGERLERVQSRGPGRVMRLPARGRFDHLAESHRQASEPGPNRKGDLSKQAKDVQLAGAGTHSTRLARFAPAALSDSDWPYEDIWVMPFREKADAARLLGNPDRRVYGAVAIHRALVKAIKEDVPSFVTGRDGDGPLRGAGHLAIQITKDPRSETLVALFGLPPGVSAADRGRLEAALARNLRVSFHGRGRVRGLTLTPARRMSALPFWPSSAPLLGTEVPMIIDAPGRPRQRSWTLEDAVTCSVGYAMRGVLERQGHEWGKGWAFRAALVNALREKYGVVARARRVSAPASRYAHRAGDGELLVAANAVIDLGTLAPHPGGFLAIGRSRHLGGGLLRPVEVVEP